MFFAMFLKATKFKNTDTYRMEQSNAPVNQTPTQGSFCGKMKRMRNVPQKKPCVEGLVARLVRIYFTMQSEVDNLEVGTPKFSFSEILV